MKADLRIKVNNFLKEKFDNDNKSFVSPVPDGKEKENARDDAHYPAQYHTMISKIIMSKLKEDK